ncbi:recombination regulator RecX [Alkalibacterium kapii]|uniref:Regulatory protein RecX n=1 Tax=Alkalibacterium kapii TaxID=426704 RepID=A0A511ARP6_9LACT|nr:recombination regulator RecX [Alkalibacterium kapii]GEK90868.1 regulatory protein RecX [Alkalibacterium kapii]
MSRKKESENGYKSLPNLIELGSSRKEEIQDQKKSSAAEDTEKTETLDKKRRRSEFVITRVQAQKAKNRFNIYVNDVYSFAVDDSMLVKYRLIKGKELDKDMIEELKEKEEMSKAYQAALHYLNFKMRTEKEIREYLIKKEYTAIEPVIERLKEHRLINDREYAKSYVRTTWQLKAEGPKKIERSLYEKGLTASEIAYGLEEYAVENQLENAEKLIEKTFKKQRNKSNREIEQKIRQQLIVKGFEREIITQVMEEISLEQTEEDEYDALVKQGEKAYRRYARKHDNYNTRHKTKTFLYQKGYPLDLIEEFLSEKEEKS